MAAKAGEAARTTETIVASILGVGGGENEQSVEEQEQGQEQKTAGIVKEQNCR